MAAGSRPPHAAEQPRPRGRRTPRQARRLRRHGQGRPRLAVLRRHGPYAADAQAGRDDARPVRAAGRRHADPRVGTARPDRQLQPGRRLGQLGGVPPAGGPRAHHVRADDRRVLDLHRDPGHPPGHLRDLRGGRREAVRRDAGRDHHAHRRSRRHGRRPAAGRHHERRRRDLHRRRPARHRAPHRAQVPGREGRLPGARAPAGRRGPRRAAAALHRPARQRGGAAAPDARRGRPRRHRHGPDQRARPARLSAGGRRLRRHGLVRGREARRLHPARPGVDGRARGGDGRLHGRRGGGLRLRQLDPGRGPARRVHAGVRLPGLRPRLHPAALLRGKGPFRWAALSGEASDIHKTDKALLDLFPENESLHRWIRMAGERVHFQGLPARICWLGQGERDKAGDMFNDMVGNGTLAAPLAIGRDHLDCGSVASPTARRKPCSTAPTRSPTGRS